VARYTVAMVVLGNKAEHNLPRQTSRLRRCAAAYMFVVTVQTVQSRI